MHYFCVLQTDALLLNFLESGSNFHESISIFHESVSAKKLAYVYTDTFPSYKEIQLFQVFWKFQPYTHFEVFNSYKRKKNLPILFDCVQKWEISQSSQNDMTIAQKFIDVAKNACSVLIFGILEQFWKHKAMYRSTCNKIAVKFCARGQFIKEMQEVEIPKDQTMDGLGPISEPIKTLKELLEFDANTVPGELIAIDLVEGTKGRSGPQTLVCHDMAGGYLEDR